MSVTRDQNVASNTSLLLDIPLKKRKGLRLHASLPPSAGCNTEQKKKRTDTYIVRYHDEDISHATPVKKRICESSSVWTDDGNVDTICINPYLNHVGSKVTSHEGETSHVSLVRKGNGQISISDLNTADHNQKAQANFSSSQKYFRILDELCSIASDVDKPLCVLDLTRKASVHEYSEKSGNTDADKQFRSGGVGHSLVTQKRNLKDKAAHASHSSASSTYFQVLPASSDGLPVNKVVYESSEISGNRTSGTQIKFDPPPSSGSWEDRCLFHNKSLSQKRCSSSTPVGIYEKSCLRTPVFDISPVVHQFKTGFTPSLKLWENKLHPSSEFGIDPKLAESQSHALPMSLRSYRSEPHRGSEVIIQTSASNSEQLSGSEPYSIYEFNIHSKIAQPKSGSPPSVKFNENDISHIFQLNARAKTETLFSSVSQQSNSSEFFQDNDKRGGADNFVGSKMNCIKSNSSKKDQEMLVPKNKLHQFRPDLVHITGRTSHSEIGAEREGDAVSKQKSYCSYEKSQGNSKKQIGESKSVTGHQYQGEEMDTKEEESSKEKKVLQHKDNSYVPKVPCYKSGIVPVTCMNNYRVVDQDINKDSRKHSEEKATMCIDDIHTLFDEKNSYGNNDYERSVLVIGDTNAGIRVHDISDSSEDNDDIEIVHCVSKSNICTKDYSVQQKELNYTDKPTGNNKFEAAARTSSKNYNGCVIPNRSGNLIDELKGDDAQHPYYRSSKAYDGIVTNGFCIQASTSVSPLCLKMHHQTPTPTPQVLPNGVYDLSCNTVIQSIGTPSSLSSACSFELPRRRLASPVHSFKFPHGKSQNVASPKYPSSSDVLSASSSVDAGGSSTLPDKKGGRDRSSVPVVDEHEESVWKPAISSSSINNFVAYSHKNINSVYCNSQEKSFEPDNQENLVPLKVIPQLTSVNDTALGTLGISHNLQEDREMFQKEEILTSVSDSEGEKKQKSIAEDKTETQKGLRHEWECAICLEAVNSKRGISATVCGHVYCTPCITEVVCKRKECPTCRKALASAQVHPLYIFG